MNPILTATSSSAGDLFNGSVFTIPMYQREYAWGSAEYEALWTDLRGGLSEGSYFLGLIILTQAQGYKEVVDGQQRLITLSLLAAALRDESRARKRATLAGQVQSTFLFALDYETDMEIPRIRFSDEDDKKAFNDLISGNDPNFIYHDMKHAYQFFREQLIRDLGNEAFKRLGQWTEFLREKLFFAVFVHPDSSSAYTVFEVINDRGKELTPADLLKNNLIANTLPPERPGVYRRWQAIARQFDDAPKDSFVQYIRHVAMVTRGYILPKNLYRKVAYGSGMAELLSELESNLDLYLQIADPTSGGPASEAAAAVYFGFNELGVTAVRPLLLAFGVGNDGELREALQMAVKITAVMSLGSANIETRFSDAATRFANADSWQSPIQPLVPARDIFVSDLPKRKLRKQTLQLLQRSINQNSATPEPVGHLQLIRPRVARQWASLPDDEFSNVGMTIGNTLLTHSRRRPRNTSTWYETKQRLIPDAVVPDHRLKLEEQEAWTVQSVRRWGSYLAGQAANVWY